MYTAPRNAVPHDDVDTTVTLLKTHDSIAVEGLFTSSKPWRLPLLTSINYVVAMRSRAQRIQQPNVENFIKLYTIGIDDPTLAFVLLNSLAQRACMCIPAIFRGMHDKEIRNASTSYKYTPRSCDAITVDERDHGVAMTAYASKIVSAFVSSVLSR